MSHIFGTHREKAAVRAFCDIYEVPLLRKLNTNELKARVEPCILHPEHVLCRGAYFFKNKNHIYSERKKS